MSGFKMKVAIAGMSGMVGTKLQKHFEAQNCEVVGLRVRPDTDVVELAKQIEKSDIVINLSGATILARWSENYKKLLYSSRIDTTKKLVEAMAFCQDKPKLFLSASAVGLFDSKNRHCANSQNYGDDFLAKICKDWESEAQRASVYNIRTINMRFGVIYAKEGGAMQKMLTPFKLGLGGIVGDGEQMISWIHLDDLVNIIDFLIKNPDIKEGVNFCAPCPLTNRQQTRVMGKLLNRPTIFPVPKFVLKLIFGEGASVILDSKEVYPTKLQEHGYKFLYPEFDDAFAQIIS